LARTYHMGAMRSGLAIGEVQALLNPHVGPGDRPPPTSAWVVNAEYPRALPGQWTVAGIAPGGGDRGGGSPPPRRRRYRETPTPPGLRRSSPAHSGGGGGARAYPRGQTLPGHDELLVRTGRALADCPPTRIKTVSRGGGRLTTDRSIIPENDFHLQNWTVSSRVSIPNVSAYGMSPSPQRRYPWEICAPGLMSELPETPYSPNLRGFQGKIWVHCATTPLRPAHRPEPSSEIDEFLPVLERR